MDPSLTITPGSAKALKVDYTAADGSNAVLLAGYSAVFKTGAFTAGGVRGPALITKSSSIGSLTILSDATGTAFYFTLSDADTATLPIGVYWGVIVVYRPDGTADAELDFTIAAVAVAGAPDGVTLFPDGTAQVKSAFAATVDNPRILADGTSTDDGSPTLGRMVNQIKDELDRPDLDGAIRNAVRAAIGFWQRERFSFNEGVLSFLTVPGQAGYGGTYLAGQPIMLAIDSAVLLEEGGNVWTLARVPVVDLETISDQAQRSTPVAYAPFAEGYRLYPVPDRVYTVRLTGHVQLGAPATDADGNAWTDEAYDLIASYAKRYLALQRLRDPALKAMMDVAVQEASSALKGLTARRTGTGRIRSYSL